MITLLVLLATVPDAAWSHAALPSVRADSGAAVYNGRLYVAGGYNSSSGLTDVLFAGLGGDGSLSSFIATTPLPNAEGGIGIAGWPTGLYVAGGNIAEVDFARFNGDGTLGAFATTNTLTRAPYGQGLIAAGGILYAVGGAHASGTAPNQTITYFTDVSVGTLGVSDGTVTWTAGAALSAGRAHHGLASDGTYLYVAGGEGPGGANGTDLADVQRALLNQGSPAAWVQTATLPSARRGVAAFVSGGFLFVIGGSNNFTRLDDVLQARIMSDGSLGAWIRTTALTTARYLHAAVASNGYLYVIGGYGNDYLSDIEWKKLSTPGPAEKLAVSGPATAQVGACAGPFTVQLHDASDAPTWADADVLVTVGNVTSVHSTSSCTADQATQFTITAATDSTQFWVRVNQGPDVAIASAAQMTGGSAEFAVTAQPSPADPHTVNGWGCASLDAGWLALLALLYSSRRATAGSRREARKAG